MKYPRAWQPELIQRFGLRSVSERREKRVVGEASLLAICIGSIVGGGWLSAALSASMIAGPAALITWTISAVAVLILALIYAELGVRYPVGAGSAYFPRIAFGTLAGFASGWFYLLNAATLAPIEVKIALTYASPYATWLTDGNPTQLSFPGYIIAAIVLAILTVINFLPVSRLANLAWFVMLFKFGALFVVIVVLLSVNGHFDNLYTNGFFVMGVPSVFVAIASPMSAIMFALLGFDQAVQFGAESGSRNFIRKAVLWSVGLSAFAYLALQLGFTVALDPGLLAGGADAWKNLGNHFADQAVVPFTTLANDTGVGWLAYVILPAALIAPVATGGLYLAGASRVLLAWARTSKAHTGFLAMVDERRAPLPAVVLVGLVGVVVLIPFPSWQDQLSFITKATVLCYALQALSLGAIAERGSAEGASSAAASRARRGLADDEASQQHEHAENQRRRDEELPRDVRLGTQPEAAVEPEEPGVLSRSPATLLALLGFVIANEIVLVGGWSANLRVGWGVVLGAVLLVVLRLRTKWLPPLDPGSLWWLPGYLIGIGAISYIGSFDGGRNWLHFPCDMFAMLVFSVVGYGVVVKGFRLPIDRAEKYIHEASPGSRGGP